MGFDFSIFHRGTSNGSIAPLSYLVVKAHYTFTHVKWHPTEPAEHFSIFDVRLMRPNSAWVEGYIYYPHPEAKLGHFQQPDVLELLLPFVEGLCCGAEVSFEIPADQWLSTPQSHTCDKIQ